MGSLALPTRGYVYVDANIIIYSVERVEPYHTLLAPLWGTAGPQSYSVVTSELSLLEVLVKPLKTSNLQLEAGFRNLPQQSSDVALIPITLSILEQAAQIRATASLKTPDAIHAATALDRGCTLFVTNDPTFRRAPGLPIVVLSDLIPPTPPAPTP